MELDSESPELRVQAQGLKGVSTIDLLAFMLSRESTDLIQNERCARDLVKKFPGARLGDLSQMDLFEASGLETFEATRILAAIELGRRMAGHGKQVIGEITSSKDAYALFAVLADHAQEHFVAAFLNTKGKVLSTKTIHIGTLNMSVVAARDLFREALRENAASIIVAHNHPSGDPTPSPEDIQITKKLAEVGRMLDIPLHDHLVIGNGTYVSLKSEGVL